MIVTWRTDITHILTTTLAAATICSCQKNILTVEDHGSYTVIHQSRGSDLGYTPESGLQIIHEEGFAFKDLNDNSILDTYEDWRRTPDERASALSRALPIDEIAGLMLYSTHQAVPTDSIGFWSSTYNGTTLRRSGLEPSAVSDKQKKFLEEDNLRSVLLVRAESPRISAEWNNNLQRQVEHIRHGIPVCIGSDPRHETKATAEYDAGSGGKISLWPCPIGLAATFSPELVGSFARIAAREYRALGICTALSPQADLATEPRWHRFHGTFGESSELDADLTRAYIDGFQTSEGEMEIADGWGRESVNAMVKHWPGCGPEEGGRDAHYSYGKYTVYPNNNFREHLLPFTEGAFRLNGRTGKAAALMPYYAISYGADPSGKNVGNGFSKYLITDVLRKECGYDGVVCSDWGMTHDYFTVGEADGKCWGLEGKSVAERHYEAIKAGIDQFGGNNEKGPVLEAYRMWCKEFGPESADARFRDSARRLLLNMFRIGLFENPYVDPGKAEKTAGNPEFMQAGYNAQIKSIVMLKNSDSILPVRKRQKVFIPGLKEKGIRIEDLERYYDAVQDASKADFALVFIDEPDGGDGYDIGDRRAGGNGYVPISLQYGPYTAAYARDTSIAGGDREENFVNRSYRGKTVTSRNQEELVRLKATRAAMEEKPVITIVSATRPMVFGEVEPLSDAILLTFKVQNQAVLEIISGGREPTGLLPMQFPKDMKTVEEQCEDTPRDMECYVDSDGNKYDFAFGLNWKGRIDDCRVKKYR